MANLSTLTFPDEVRVDSGVLAKVYKVNDPRDGLIKALKKYPKRYSDYDFDREVLVHSRIRHENIIAFIASYKPTREETAPRILMEFCEEGTLRNKLKAAIRGAFRIDPNTRDEWLKGLISGIRYLHEYSDSTKLECIVHGDIHPRNILFKQGFIKIGGFRFSRRVSSGSQPNGSLRYTSPEMVDTLESQAETMYTPAVDIWSYGCIFYELHTLNKVFNGRDDGQIIYAHLEFDEPPPIERGPAITELYTRMLSMKPSRRPSANQIFNAI